MDILADSSGAGSSESGDPEGAQSATGRPAHRRLARRLAGGRPARVLRTDLRIRTGVAAGLAAVAALVTSWWMPGGPMTTTQALGAMAIGALVGIAAGVAMRFRWAMLLAPLVFIAVFEIARTGVNGPTIDSIHPRNTNGVSSLSSSDVASTV